MIKILADKQIRQADRYTIEHEPIQSIDLMERAAEELARTIAMRVEQQSSIIVVAGKGNNGGDGLAVARMLFNAGFDVSVSLVHGPEEMSEECRFNYERLPSTLPVNEVYALPQDAVIVDAILGTGVKGMLRNKEMQAIEAINHSGAYVISLDLPSGMKTEFGNDPAMIVHSDVTITIEFPKLAMLLPEAGGCCGQIEIVSIGLDEGFLRDAISCFYYVDAASVSRITLPRNKFSHKGDYGHALLVCGSRGMVGAAVLATCSALRSGCGLVTAHLPAEERFALHANAPSAMVSCDEGSVFSTTPIDLDKYDVCGVGCGLGEQTVTREALLQLMRRFGKPMVVDADALNIIAGDRQVREAVVPGSVLTPHPGEFRRLVGNWENEEQKLLLLRKLATELQSIIVLKGASTITCTADGRLYFNSTGNPGMAKGGSGDVLTGLITGLAARGYTMEESAIRGVYLHGLAADKAAEYFGAEGMNSSDITDFLGEAELSLR